jgi:hypothetical protein
VISRALRAPGNEMRGIRALPRPGVDLNTWLIVTGRGSKDAYVQACAQLAAGGRAQAHRVAACLKQAEREATRVQGADGAA